VSVLVAILLALGVPFAQLQTVNDRITCCCPDPDQCKCPDHKADKSAQTQMGTCHKSATKTVRAQLAAFVSPVVIDVLARVPRPIVIAHVLPAPHAPPPPQRPAAPS
jgi:hypothetical protein